MHVYLLLFHIVNNRRAMARLYTGRVPAMVIMVVALYMCALSICALLSSRDAVGGMIGDVRISVEVVDGDKIDLKEERTTLEAIEGVRAVQYIYGSQADSEFSKFIGEDITDFMGGRVLPSTFVLTVDALCPLDELCAEIGQKSWVSEIYYESTIVDTIVERTQYVVNLVRAIAIIIAVFSLIVIFCSIRLMVAAQFRNCDISKYRLLRRMIYRWAWVSPILGSIFAIALIYFTVSYLEIIAPELSLSFSVLPLVAALTVVVAVVVSLFSTFISILSYYRQQ